MPCTAYLLLKYKIRVLLAMTKPEKLAKRPEILPRADDVFEDFRREIETMMRPWPAFWHFPKIEKDIRFPLYEISDKGDRYEIKVEVPGIEKDKVDVRATGDYVEVLAEHAQKTDEEKKNYIYNERTYRSFYRKISLPEEVEPSKINASMKDGILVLELPKKEIKARKQVKVDVK